MTLKKIIALAAVLPLAAVAQDAPPPVQVYGTINVNLQYTEAADATAANADVSPRFAIATDSTNIGVRANLDLGHGYKGVAQCETQANVDGEDLRAICNRNSRVGLSGFWGTLFYGNWDTPFKALTYGTKADDPFGNTDVFGHQGIMGSPGYGTRSSAFNGSSAAGSIVTASFDQRAANSIAYWSPKVSGVSGRVQYSLPENRDAAGIVTPFLVSAAVNYDQGPLSVAAGVEYHEDAFGIRRINAANAGNETSTALAWRLGAGYELPLGPGALRLMGVFEQLTYAQDDAAAGFKDYSRMAWLLGASFRTGPHELRGRFSQALDPDITAATGTTLPAGAEDNLAATSWAVGYAYHFAKSTQVYVFGTQIMNDDAARYTFGVGGAAAIVGGSTPTGADPLAVGAGIRMAF